MNELYKVLNQEIEYFFDEQEFLERDYLFIDVSDYSYLLIGEDEINTGKLMFGREIVGIELEEERLKVVFDRFFLQDLRQELFNDWNDQEIVKRRNWIYR